MLFTTGGIGPTHDDITSECIAAAFGVPWEVHGETDRIMQAAMGERYNAARRRMATMPRGAMPITCEASLAPGFSVGNVHVMAGVPRIMQSQFAALEPSLPEGTPGALGAVAIVAKGTDVAALEAAIEAATGLIATQGVVPVQGEPPPAE